MMQGRAILTCWRFGTRTCSVSNDASHNHNGNNGGNHAASTPFPTPRIIWVTYYGFSVCHFKPPTVVKKFIDRKIAPRPAEALHRTGRDLRADTPVARHLSLQTCLVVSQL